MIGWNIFYNKCFKDLGFLWEINQLDRVMYNHYYFYYDRKWKTGDFQPEQDTCQGNPISPYIFITCAEYLWRYNHFMSTQEWSGIGIKLTKDSPKFMFNVCRWLLTFFAEQLKMS